MEQKGGEDQKKRSKRSVLNSRAEYARLGAWLRQQREQIGLQQKPVSRGLDRHERFLNRIELGTQRMDLVEFMDLYRALGLDLSMPIGELFTVMAEAPGSD